MSAATQKVAFWKLGIDLTILVLISTFLLNGVYADEIYDLVEAELRTYIHSVKV
jgi:hypothetical protein